MSDDPPKELYVPNLVPESDHEFIQQKKRYGNRVGWGDRPAILIVDMTLAFLEERRTGENCVEATANLLETARNMGIPVFHTIPKDSDDYPDGYPVPTKASPASDRGPDDVTSKERTEWLTKLDQIAPELEPLDDETVIEKARASAFFDTHLSNLLHYYDVDTLVVAGMNTSGCVRATVVDGFSSNFRIVVPHECVADVVSVSHKISLFDMDYGYADVTSLESVLDRLESYA